LAGEPEVSVRGHLGHQAHAEREEGGDRPLVARRGGGEDGLVAWRKVKGGQAPQG